MYELDDKKRKELWEKATNYSYVFYGLVIVIIITILFCLLLAFMKALLINPKSLKTILLLLIIIVILTVMRALPCCDLTMIIFEKLCAKEKA